MVCRIALIAAVLVPFCHAQQQSEVGRNTIVMTMKRFIDEPVMNSEDAAEILLEAGFTDGGRDDSGARLFLHRSLGSRSSLDYEMVAERTDGEELLGPVYYWRLGFRGIAFDVSSVSYTHLTLPTN